MRKTVGVLSLIVMLLSQVFSPFVYAVSGEEVPIPEPVVEEVISEPEVAPEVDNSTGDNDFKVVEPSTGEVADLVEPVDVEVNTGTVISTGEETKNLEEEGTEASSGFIEKITETIKDFLGITGEENENFESKEIYGTGEYEGVKVEVYAQTGLFASGTELTIEPVVEEKLQAVQEVLLSGEVDFVEEQVIAFDITFRDPETQEELQPKDGTVQVKFNYEENDSLVQAEEDAEQEVKVYHLNDIDEEGKKIEEITGSKLEEVIINEEKSEEENVMVVEANSFSIYTIVQQVKEECPLAENENQLANFVYGEISIADPNNPGSGFTIMDRNLGALEVGTGDNSKAYGYHYQWGNNYGFNSIGDLSAGNKTGIKIDVSLISTYSGNQFVWGESNLTWMSGSNNNDLWNGENRQGPCPDGWHVPTIEEWNQLLIYYAGYYTGNNMGDVSLGGNQYKYVWGNNPAFASGFYNYFQIPFAGLRLNLGANVGSQGSYAYLWSSTPSDDYARDFRLSSSSVDASSRSSRASGFSVRCFKDNYSGTGEIHTITFNFNGGSGSTAAINVLSGEKAIEPEIPIKEGYEFLGWYEKNGDEYFTESFDFTGSIITEDITLYAKWRSYTMLVSGKDFAYTIKKLADSNTTSFSTDNTNIREIKRSFNEPQNQTTENVSLIGADVLVWFDDGVIYYYTEAEKIYMNSDSSYMFCTFKNVENLELTYFDASKVINMERMFWSFKGNVEINFNNFDTSNVVNMSYMFYYYTGVGLDLSNFNTESVLNMDYMFSNYGGPTLIQNFDTKNVLYMSKMFEYCRNLKTLNLSNFSIGQAVNVSYILGWNNFDYLNLDNWDFSNVGIYAGILSTSNVVRLSAKGWKIPINGYFFKSRLGLNSVEEFDVTNWDLSGTVTMSHALEGLGGLKEIVGIGSWKNTDDLINMEYMLNGNVYLKKVDMSGANFQSVGTMNSLFSNCDNLEEINMTNVALNNLQDIGYMFYTNPKLKIIYIGNNFNSAVISNSNFAFSKSPSIVGGNGTKYDSTKTDKTYAKIDKEGQVGYFTDPSHFAIRFKEQNGEEITTQWISTGGTAQALTGRLTYYRYYTGDDLLHKFDLTTPLYVYTEIYATGLDAYEIKFYSGDNIIYTGYVSGDNQSKLIMPSDPIKEGYDFVGWTVGSTSDLFNFDEIVTSDLELYANWSNPKEEYEGTIGCYDYRSYYEGGEYLAEITNYRRDNTSCLGNNLVLPDVIKRNGRDYKVVSLGADSFKQKGISGLLTLSQYLKSIGNMAFIGNSDLTGIVFNDNLESIGTQSFQLCGIKSLSFPASLRSIGSIAFTANTSLTSVNFAESTNTLEIGSVAFYGCSIENVNIPQNVRSIGQQSFEDNPLKTVRVLSENVTIGGSAFKAKNNSIETLVLSGGGELTSSMFGSDYDSMFSNLTTLKLGNGVTRIGTYLFRKTKLTTVKIPGSVTLLDSNSFASNDLLQEIVIEEGLKTINPGVFSNNKKLKTLIIPNSVTDISGNTLNNNPELESVKFGNGIERLQSILENCPSLNHLDLGNVKELYSTISGTQLESLTIPASMVIIGQNTFEHNPNLTTLVFEGNSLTKIGTGAFNDTSITNIVLPNSLTILGNLAFCSDSSSNPGSIIGIVSGATAAQIESLEAQDNTECLVLKKDKYTLTYNAGAHSGLVDNQPTLGVVVDYNGTIQLTGNGAKTATSQKGYTFLGWTTELNGTVPLAANTYTITGDVTLYPVFKKDSITKKIKFYKNGNEGYTYNGNDYTEDQEFILCTIQERYNADEDITTCSENIEFPMGISETTPVTRGWTRNIGGDGMLYTGGEQIEVTSEDSTISYYLQMYAPEKVFKANYEYGSGVEELTITSGSCMIAETINGNVQSGSCEVALPELNVLTGYHTPLWYKKGEDITYPNLTITLTGDEILEAKAIANTYTVVYQPGEGTGEMESQEFEYDKAESLNKNKYRKEGYHFSGWIDMLGKEYRDGEKVLNLLTEGVLELTAQWLQNPPAAGGGQSVNPATKELEHNAAEEKQDDKQESNQDKQQDETVKDESKTPENTNTSNQTNTQESSNTSSDNSYKTVVDPEIQSAYEWAYERDVTTIPSLDDAMPDGVVKRGHLAKMVVNYATNVLGREIPEKIPSECRWNDWRKDWESEEIKDYAVKSCALGLMGLDMPKFLPNMEVTRAQFGTIMSRLLWGKKYAGGTPYYRKHLNALKENNIMMQIENPEKRVELRQWVWLMLMRSAENK